MRKREGGRGGLVRGLSVEKTAMKGNCHAPALVQEHLSGGEHAKWAGHVLTTHTHTHTHTLMLHRLDSMPVKLSLGSFAYARKS